MSTWQLLQPTRRRLLHRRSQRLRPPARRPRRPSCQLRPRRPRSRRHNPYRHCSAAAWGGGAAGRADGQSSFVSFELQAATKFDLIFCHSLLTSTREILIAGGSNAPAAHASPVGPMPPTVTACWCNIGFSGLGTWYARALYPMHWPVSSLASLRNRVSRRPLPTAFFFHACFVITLSS